MARIEDYKDTPLNYRQKKFLLYLEGQDSSFNHILVKLGVTRASFYIWLHNDVFKEELDNLISADPLHRTDLMEVVEAESLKDYYKRAKELKGKLNGKITKRKRKAYNYFNTIY